MDELDKMSRMVKWYIAIAAILVAAFVWYWVRRCRGRKGDARP